MAAFGQWYKSHVTSAIVGEMATVRMAPLAETLSDVQPGGILGALTARAAALGGGAAPVERWNPPDCGPIPMRIDRDGTWHYAGSPILRERLVFLFARILRRESDGTFVLVTPHEKVTIEVVDVPFVVPEFAVDGTGTDQIVVARTNVGDVVRAGSQHPIRFTLEAGTEGMVPYVLIRGGLEARFTRAAAYDLADAMSECDGEFGVWSEGVFHSAGEAAG